MQSQESFKRIEQEIELGNFGNALKLARDESHAWHCAISQSLDFVKYLQSNQIGGFCQLYMDKACQYGHLDIVQWLYWNREENFSEYAILFAGFSGYYEIVEWLHYNTTAPCCDFALAFVMPHKGIARFLYNNRKECKTEKALQFLLDSNYKDFAYELSPTYIY